MHQFLQPQNGDDKGTRGQTIVVPLHKETLRERRSTMGEVRTAWLTTSSHLPGLNLDEVFLCFFCLRTLISP